MTDDDRHARGIAVMEKLFGSAPTADETSAEMMAVTTEHLFGDIWCRPGLDHRDRELITVSVIAALLPASNQGSVDRRRARQCCSFRCSRYMG